MRFLKFLGRMLRDTIYPVCVGMVALGAAITMEKWSVITQKSIFVVMLALMLGIYAVIHIMWRLACIAHHRMHYENL